MPPPSKQQCVTPFGRRRAFRTRVVSPSVRSCDTTALQIRFVIGAPGGNDNRINYSVVVVVVVVRWGGEGGRFPIAGVFAPGAR